MRKFISPTVAFFMGLFMHLAAVGYTMVITSVMDITHINSLFKLWIGLPAIFLVLYGASSMVWAISMWGKLRFSAEADAWVLK